MDADEVHLLFVRFKNNEDGLFYIKVDMSDGNTATYNEAAHRVAEGTVFF